MGGRLALPWRNAVGWPIGVGRREDRPFHVIHVMPYHQFVGTQFDQLANDLIMAHRRPLGPEKDPHCTYKREYERYDEHHQLEHRRPSDGRHLLVDGVERHVDQLNLTLYATNVGWAGRSTWTEE